jgi:hypothetical protein
VGLEFGVMTGKRGVGMPPTCRAFTKSGIPGDWQPGTLSVRVSAPSCGRVEGRR